FAVDAIHGQLAPHAEKSARRLDLDVFRLDRCDPRSPAEIDVDILGLQTPIEPDGPAGVEVLRLDGTLHLHGAARREVFDLGPPLELGGHALFNGFRQLVYRNARGASGTEF